MQFKHEERLPRREAFFCALLRIEATDSEGVIAICRPIRQLSLQVETKKR
jgi:hypothetical protein